MESVVASPNAQLNAGFIAKLRELKISKVIVCPGSRNAPLLFSLQNFSDEFSVYNHLDERGAGFFALGLCMTSRESVAVVTTSGTAAAELLPACIEAYYQNLPLVLITADRPAEYRGSGAPQAIEQIGLYSVYAKTIDISSASDFSRVPSRVFAPVHLNICLGEARADDWAMPTEVARRITTAQSEADDHSRDLSALPQFLGGASCPVAIVGSVLPDEAPALAKFLAELDIPVLADTASNLQNVKILRCGEKILQGNASVSHIVRFGSVPSFRFWRDLETNDLPVLNVVTAPFSGLARKTEMLRLRSYRELEKLAPAAYCSSLRADFSHEDAKYSEALEKLLRKFPQSELGMLRAVAASIPARAALYLGNSLPVREWNLVNGLRAPCFANRGANGIDGQVASFLGVSEKFTETWGVIGDQTALYDLNALAIRTRSTAKRRIVVINNGGGKIFAHLNYSPKLSLAQARLIENQHRFELRAWADLFAWAYERWDRDAQASEFVADDQILEIFPDSLETHHFWQEWRSLR